MPYSPRIAAWLAWLCIFLLVAPVHAERLQPGPTHARASQVVAELLSRYHYRDQSIDDRLSESVYASYFDTLDPQRFYFLQSDIDSFASQRDQLDDELSEGRLDTAYAIFARYKQRVAERSEYALAMLDDGVDFDSQASFELDRDDAPWASNRQALDEVWQRRVTNDALTQTLNGRAMDEVVSSLKSRYQRLTRTLEQYSPEDVFQTFMSTWAAEFDPHSSYMSPRTSENFDINMSLSLEGIGAMLSNEGDFVEIVELIPGGPAAGSGELASGDRIVGVGDQRDAIQDVVGWRLGDVVDLIRGAKGSDVHLRILPASTSGQSRETVITLTRNTIELDEQAAQADIETIERDGRTQTIGVIELPAFYADFNAANAGNDDYRSTTRDVAALLRSDKLADIDGLIIDLRGNAGGSLEEAVKLTGLFVDQGPVVQVHRSNGRREVLRDPDTGPALYDQPLAVMVDSGSASASEIFAAAIQDYGRGLVIGDQTFGKGTVQTLIGLDRFGVGTDDQPAGRLKLTIAKFYRINGESTQLEGVTPDLSMPYPHGSEAVGERAADNALPWDTVRSAQYDRDRGLDAVINELRRRHQRRIRTEPALQSVSAEAKRAQKARERTRVSLNKAVREAELKADEAARLEAVNAQLTATGNEPVESLEAVDTSALPDVLLTEAAAVLADLIELTNETEQITAEAGTHQALAR
jgi:C-terminal processing peptidase-1. Serine peptidase. MEROPS family S41A